MEEFGYVVIGAILTWLGTVLHGNYFSIRSQSVNYIDDYLRDLGTIESLAVEYWSKNASAPEEKLLSARLRGALHSSSIFLEYSKNALGNDHPRFTDLDGEMYDAATGGDFDGADRVESYERIVRIATTASELRHLLRAARMKTYWAR